MIQAMQLRYKKLALSWTRVKLIIDSELEEEIYSQKKET